MHFNIYFPLQGKVVSCDNCFATLYGYPSAEEMKDLDIRELIPSINLDSENYCGDLVPKVCCVIINVFNSVLKSPLVISLFEKCRRVKGRNLYHLYLSICKFYTIRNYKFIIVLYILHYNCFMYHFYLFLVRKYKINVLNLLILLLFLFIKALV